jgi:hypothetical protein
MKDKFDIQSLNQCNYNKRSKEKKILVNYVQKQFENI